MTLDSPRTIRILIRICLLGLVLLAGVDLFFSHKAHFKHQNVTVDAWPFFYPVFGFAACVAMVWGAKKLFGTVLMRPEAYYRDDDESESEEEGLLADHASEQPSPGHDSAAPRKDGA